jgi:hypothetical protein
MRQVIFDDQLDPLVQGLELTEEVVVTSVQFG